MYHDGSSSTLRRMTAGVTVPEYPRPIIGTSAVLRAASAAKALRTSTSLMACGRSSGLPARIWSGRAAYSRSSMVSKPNAPSIADCSAASGPMWRRENGAEASWVPRVWRSLMLGSFAHHATSLPSVADALQSAGAGGPLA